MGTTGTRTPRSACLFPRVPWRPRGSGAQWVKMRTNKRGGVADQRTKGDRHEGNDDDCAPEPSAVLGRVRAMGRSIGSRPGRSVPGNRRRPIADASQQRPFWFVPDERKAGAMSGLRFERPEPGGRHGNGGRSGDGPVEISAGAWVKGRTVDGGSGLRSGAGQRRGRPPGLAAMVSNARDCADFPAPSVRSRCRPSNPLRTRGLAVESSSGLWHGRCVGIGGRGRSAGGPSLQTHLTRFRGRAGRAWSIHSWHAGGSP